MGHGYGSEFHLLRYLGFHRRELSRAIGEKTSGRVLEWLDFSFDPKKTFQHLDVEWKGLDFLGSNASVISAWKNFWPQTGNVPNWDAVGLLRSESQVEFLLVEAKARASEIKNDCEASEHGGLPKIKEAFAETISANGFDSTVKEWLGPYYQYANRLAHLHYLLKHNISARFIFIYFLGDQWPERGNGGKEPVTCPASEQEWNLYLQRMYEHLGLKGLSKLERRIHRLFLQVGGPASKEG